MFIIVLTTLLLNQIRDDTITTLNGHFTHGAVGVDNTTPVVGNTALNQEVFRDAADETDLTVTGQITKSLRLLTTEANNNTINEGGWFDAAAITVDDLEVISGWTDSSDMTTSANTSTTMEGAGAMNLTKDGTGSADANTTKAVGSDDFTSKLLAQHLFILDQTTLDLFATTSCVSIRYGSDSSNYYQWDFNKSELAVGQNRIELLNSANADSTTGTPVETAMDYYFIQITSTASGDTWSAGAVILDDINISSGDLWVHDLLTGILKTEDIQLYLDTQITATVTET